MTSIIGSVAPLHRKFDEKDALRQVRSRYIGMRPEIFEQVKALQADERFLTRCEGYYAHGYKDWHILSAIYNLMMRCLQENSELDLRRREHALQFQKEAVERIRGLVLPIEKFLTSQLDEMFEVHAMTCLARQGFELRGPISGVSAIKFLRDRMRHFELDVPHPQMFVRPPGEWPDLKS
jgi:hypothetical protein